MGERDAMLMAVLASPADDLPRLVYADWLDEQGEADRAEFVRVQCRIATLNAELMSDEDCDATNCPGCGERRELQRRERELWLMAVAEELPARWVLPPPDGFTFRKLPGDEWETDGRPHISQAEYRRGFVGEIRLPMASLMGSECERCNGSGRVRYYHPVEIEGVDDCPACVGEPFPGRVGGAMRGIFRTHPVTAVRLTDKSPEEVGAGWSWFTEGFADDPATLPHEVFDLLGGDYDVSMLGQRVTYPTRLAAQDALSDAIVRHGRAAAGVADQLPTEDAKC